MRVMFAMIVGLLMSVQSALTIMLTDVTPTSELAMENAYRSSKPSLAEVLDTKYNLNGIKVQECSAMPVKGMESYSGYKLMGTLRWFRTMWTVMDILLGQFMLTPVSAVPITWSHMIPGGSLSKDSYICTSYQAFRQGLEGYEVKRVVLGAGSTSVECMDPTIAQQITDAFSSGAVRTFSCHGNSWAVGGCGEGVTISVSLVTDSQNCQCDEEEVLIRPCINNVNWGGTGRNVCNSVTTTLSITVYDDTTNTPTSLPTESPTTLPTATPTETPTTLPTATPTDSPTTQPTVTPSKIPTTIPTDTPTETPTSLPTWWPSSLPTETPTKQPTLSITQYENPLDNVIVYFDIVDKNGDESLNYDEIVFAIADTSKDGMLSFEEYQAARAERHFVDTSYTLTNSSTNHSSDGANLVNDFGIIDRNGDGFLIYDEVAFAIADTTKDGKLSVEEYEAAFANGIFVDTAYPLE